MFRDTFLTIYFQLFCDLWDSLCNQVKYKEKYEREKGKAMLDFETPTYVSAKEAQHMQSQVNQWFFITGSFSDDLPLHVDSL